MKSNERKTKQMKATGLEITTFWKEWPMGDDWFVDYFDECPFGDNDEECLNPDEKYELTSFGELGWQGKGAAPKKWPWGTSIQSAFKKWKMSQTHVLLSVKIPKDMEDGFREYAKQNNIIIS